MEGVIRLGAYIFSVILVLVFLFIIVMGIGTQVGEVPSSSEYPYIIANVQNGDEYYVSHYTYRECDIEISPYIKRCAVPTWSFRLVNEALILKVVDGYYVKQR